MTEQSRPCMLVIDASNQYYSEIEKVFGDAFTVTCINSAKDAVAHLQKNTVDIVLANAKIGKMDGVTLLAKIEQELPDIAKVLMVNDIDVKSLISAINRGEIRCVLQLPLQDNALELVQKAWAPYEAKHQIEELTAELIETNAQMQDWHLELDEKVRERTKQLDATNQRLKKIHHKQRKTLQNLLDMIRSIIEYRVGFEEGIEKDIPQHARMVAENLDVDKSLVSRVYLAAVMHDLGKVPLPDMILQTHEAELTADQRIELKAHPEVGAEIISHVHSFEDLADIVATQYENFNGSGTPKGLKNEEIPLAARILRVVSDYNRLIHGLMFKERYNTTDAYQYLRSNIGSLYDPKVVDAYDKVVNKDLDLDLFVFDQSLTTDKLEPGMVLAKDILDANKEAIFDKDFELDQMSIDLLKNMEEDMGSKLKVYVVS